jgi:dTDP-4-amino-4,6-dideoxygalactose transaminase
MKIQFSKVTIGDEEIKAVNRVLKSGWLAAGKETEAFEKEFARYVGVKYAIFTNSCTSALKMAYKWAKNNHYDSIIYPKNTFCATYAAAEETGLCIENYKDFEDRLKRINHPEIEINYYERVNVHYGSIKDETPCLIEDSAHRIEKNDPLIGKIRCYSFYATKNMTTGSGGMLVTNDKDIYERCRLYWRDGLSSSTNDRLQGKSWNYKVKTMAGGYDGNDIAAAIGRVQLRKLPIFTKRRNEIRDKYNQEFNQDWQGNHLYPYFVKSIDEIEKLITFLREKGIMCGYHYPNTGWLGVSLPIYPLLTNKEVNYIIRCIKEYENSNL